MPSITNLYRSNSVPADLRAAVGQKRESPLTAELQKVKVTQASISDGKGDSTKSTLLNFRNDYRLNAADGMSKESTAFKTAYTNGNPEQKRNLENIAVVICLARAQNNTDSDEKTLKTHISNWLVAIDKGNKKPDCRFTSDQNNNVDRKNKERDDYRKSINDLGLYLEKRTKEPGSLASQVMDDVREKCRDVINRYGLDASNVEGYLEQTALSAEESMREAMVGTSTNLPGIDYLKKATFCINSRLNFPNYLRNFSSKKEKPEDTVPHNVPNQPSRANDGVPPGTPPNVPGAATPAQANPIVINLSNIGNSKAEANNLGPQNSAPQNSAPTYNFTYNYYINDCSRVHGNSSEPYNFTAQLKNRDQLQNAGGSESRENTSQNSTFALKSERINTFLGLNSSSSGIDGIYTPPVNSSSSGIDGIATHLGPNSSFDTDEIDSNIPLSSATSGKSIIAESGIETVVTDNLDTSTLLNTTSLDPSNLHHAATQSTGIDTFIAKQDRAGVAITLSQNGMRPNLVGSDNTAFRRRSLEDSLFTNSAAKQKGPHNVETTQASNVSLANKTYRPQHLKVENPELTFEDNNKADSNSRINLETALSGTNEKQQIVNNATNDTETFTGNDAKEGLQSQQPTERKKFYSPYLDENNNIRNPVTLTVDGLHTQNR